VAQSLLYVVGVSAWRQSGKNIHQRLLRKLKGLVCVIKKDSAFIGPEIDLYQEIECGIQYTLSRSLPIAAFPASTARPGPKIKSDSPEEETWLR
jgi:hypothetical protein